MKALFIDLAGVLLEPAPFPGRDGGLRSGVGAALRLLERLDFRIFILGPCSSDRRRSNRDIADRVADLLLRERINVAGYCGCFQAPGACADCAPAPGRLLRAAGEHGIVLAASWLLGARVQHIEAGTRAGCRTVLIEDDACRAPGAHPGHVRSSRDAYAAALVIAALEHARE